MALKISQALYSFVLVFITAWLTKYLVDMGIVPFYDTLSVPDITPDRHYFPYVWGIIYVLMFISFYLALISPKTSEQFYDINALFATQLFLQILWAFSFFFLHQLWASAVVIVLLDLAVALLMHSLFYVNLLSFALMLPYLFWILFATYLNIFIIFLN